jgi:serine/threonine protein kinase
VKYCERCHLTWPHDFTTCPRDQQPLAEVKDLAPGLVLRGKYQIIQKLGAGGMAEVYRARHLAFGEVRAIKVVSRQTASDPDFVQRFRSEAIVTRRLQHPNAVRVDDLDETEDGRPFIVMECVEGESLRHAIQREGPLPPARVVAIGRQACDALAAAHRLGIVHRDMKPDNILLAAGAAGTGDHVKVVDFGIAKAREQVFEGTDGYHPTQTGVVLGTPQYMSPEQASGKSGDALDGRSDLYSLGVVLYEALTGRLPFHTATPMVMLMNHVQTAPVPMEEARPGVPPALARVVMRALEKAPERRFEDALAMEKALASVVALMPPWHPAPRTAGAPAASATLPAPPVASDQPIALPFRPPPASEPFVRASRPFREVDPRVQTLLDEGDRALDDGRTDDARLRFEEVLRLEPGNPAARLGLRRVVEQSRRR